MGIARPDTEPEDMGGDDIDDVDVAILRELANGDRTIGALADALDVHRNTIRNHMNVLERDPSFAECIHDNTALYSLTEKGEQKLEACAGE